MPISQRLSGNIYSKLTDLVTNSTSFIFFGTYSMSVDRSILSRIVYQKQNNPNLLVACLLPPPTDFILWDFSVRRQLLNAYGLSSSNPVDLARIMAENPQPAYAALDALWNQSRGGASQRNVTSHIRRIAELYSNNIITLLEPNMHAKFVASESNIYEGSGNLTHFGLRVNVEVYNFYPRTYEGIYRYAISSYVSFLRVYLVNFVDWKLGNNYLINAHQLGTRIEQIASEFQVRFNPKVSREKIDALTKTREKLSVARSELWQLPGHRLLLKIDFLLSQANLIGQRVLSTLWGLVDKEMDKETAAIVMKDLEKVSSALKQTVPFLKDLTGETSECKLWYESEYLEKSIAEAHRFEEYLNKFEQKLKKSARD
jgi:hypothetical protein